MMAYLLTFIKIGLVLISNRRLILDVYQKIKEEVKKESQNDDISGA